MPVAIRNILEPGPRTTLMRISQIFSQLCTRTVNPTDMLSLKLYTAETLCLMEATLPPSFFDIMTHLLIHLVEELAYFGPVTNRWCYPIERYLCVLKKYVRNRAKPEGSMAAGYVVDEAVGFTTTYLKDFPYTSHRIWDMSNDPTVEGVRLEGTGQRRQLSDIELCLIHQCVAKNSPASIHKFR